MERKTRGAKIGDRPGKFTILKNCKVCSKKLSVSEPSKHLVVFHPEITSLIRMVHRKLSASSSEVKGNFPSMDCSDLCATKVLAKSLIDSILKNEPNCFNLVEKLSEKISSVSDLNLISNEPRQCGLCDLTFNSISKTIEHLTFHHPKYLALVIFLRFRSLSEINGCHNQISVNQTTSEKPSQRIANSHILGSRQPVILVEKLPDHLYRKCIAKGCVKVKDVTKYNIRRQKKENSLLRQIVAKKLLNKQHEKEARKEAVYWQKGLTAYVQKSRSWHLDEVLLDARKILKTRDGYENVLEFVNGSLESGRVRDTVKYYLDKIFKANEKVQILLSEADDLDKNVSQNIVHYKTLTPELDNEVSKKKRKRVNSVSSNNNLESGAINKGAKKKRSKPVILDKSFEKETNFLSCSELNVHFSPKPKDKTTPSSLIIKENFTLEKKIKEELDCISYLKPVDKPKVSENKFLRNAREHLKAKKLASKKKVPCVNLSPKGNCSEEEIKNRHHHPKFSTPKAASDVEQLKGNTIDLIDNSSLVTEDKQIIECFCGKPDCEGLHPEIFTF